MPRFHRHESSIWQGKCHLIGVMGSDAGGAELLQQQGFERGHAGKGAGQINQWLPGPDPAALRRHDFDRNRETLFSSDVSEPLDHQAVGSNDRPADEERIGDFALAEMRDDRLSAVEIRIGARRDLALAQSELRADRRSDGGIFFIWPVRGHFCNAP